MKNASLTIDLSILTILGEKLYSNSLGFIIPREFLQNSLDSGATEIDVTYDPNTRYFRVWDNGSGIANIEKLILSIGTSGDDKRKGKTVGGYGVGGKLTMLSCPEFELKSKGGRIDHILFNGGNDIKIDDSETCDFTRVIVKFDEKHVTWNTSRAIGEFLSLIDKPGVTITYNGKQVEKALLSTMTLDSGEIITLADGIDNTGYMWIRVNGLPTFKTYVYFDHTVIVDISTNLSPYDDNYPLSVTRESLVKGTPEYEYVDKLFSDIMETRNRISREQSERERQNALGIDGIHEEKPGIYLGGTFTKTALKMYDGELSTLTRYIKQVSELVGIENPPKPGLTNKPDCKASYIPDYHVIMLNPETVIKGKGGILSVVLHELCHIENNSHDTDFTVKLNEYTSVVLNAILYGEFRK